MQVDIVAPSEVPVGAVAVVVDELRASSTIVTLLERGCERVVAAASIEEALRLHERLPDHLLCGEIDSVPPEGFDYGNSPAEFARLDLSGKSAILATTNGTKAIATASQRAARVLVGSLLNLSAVRREAMRLAEGLGTRLVIIYGSDESDDLATASAIVGDLKPEDAATEVRRSHHADELRAVGLGEDVEFCARVDVSHIVPILTVAEGLLILQPVRLSLT